MKRTKKVNLTTFRKSRCSSRITPIALAVSVAFILASCEKNDETVSLYQNADDCSKANLSSNAQCIAAYNTAKQVAEKTAPRYASREDCIAEFGEGQCTQAPAQVGVTSVENQSMWMPLMAGYMMGRTLNSSYAQQPLFSSKNPASPANGKFVGADGKNYGPAAAGGRIVHVPKTAMTPKPNVTNTITRGGFGDNVAKQASMQHNSSTAVRGPGRSMGG